MGILLTILFSWLIYLFLTAGSGNFILWSPEEIVFGLLFAVLASLLIRKIFPERKENGGLRYLNPIRWFMFLLYAFGPFLYRLTIANLDVAYRVITGKINPGIVKISSGLRTDAGLVMLANSITLTPGTLTVDMDENNLYVHAIHLKSKNPERKEICSHFSDWIRRITE